MYDLLRTVRLRFPSFTGVLDLLYCLTAGGALSLFVLRQADGQFRGFILLGAAGGSVVFFMLFSAFLRPVWDFWLDRSVEFLHLLVLACAERLVNLQKNRQADEKPLLFL